MPFQENRFVRQTTAYNAGQITTTFNPETGAVVENGPAWFTYASATETLATIVAANYFAPVVYMLAVNDRIDITGSDASGMYIVATVDRDAGTITLVSYSASGVVGTANIQNGAVTADKLATDSVTTVKIEDGAVTSDKVSELLIQHAQVDIDLATFIGSYTASALLLAAPGANQKIILHRATIWVDYGGTVLADGGAVHIQYDDTANAAGVAATGTIAAAAFIGATADTTFGFSPVDTSLPDATTLNQGLYLATATQDFTGGTSSAYKVDLWYSILDVA